MEDKVTVELTDEERGIICTALGYWADHCPYINEDNYNKAIEILSKIAEAY